MNPKKKKNQSNGREKCPEPKPSTSRKRGTGSKRKRRKDDSSSFSSVNTSSEVNTSDSASESNRSTIRKRRPMWGHDELMAMLHAANAHRKYLRGGFESHSNGKSDRKEAWQKVADAANVVSHYMRTPFECKQKVTHFMCKAKKKNSKLCTLYARTGAGPIPPDKRLKETEILILDYAGEEPVLGIMGVAATPLERISEKELHVEPNRESTPFSWNPRRKDKPIYNTPKSLKKAKRMAECDKSRENSPHTQQDDPYMIDFENISVPETNGRDKKYHSQNPEEYENSYEALENTPTKSRRILEFLSKGGLKEDLPRLTEPPHNMKYEKIIYPLSPKYGFPRYFIRYILAPSNNEENSAIVAEKSQGVDVGPKVVKGKSIGVTSNVKKHDCHTKNGNTKRRQMEKAPPSIKRKLNFQAEGLPKVTTLTDTSDSTSDVGNCALEGISQQKGSQPIAHSTPNSNTRKLEGLSDDRKLTKILSVVTKMEERQDNMEKILATIVTKIDYIHPVTTSKVIDNSGKPSTSHGNEIPKEVQNVPLKVATKSQQGRVLDTKYDHQNTEKNILDEEGNFDDVTASLSTNLIDTTEEDGNEQESTADFREEMKENHVPRNTVCPKPCVKMTSSQPVTLAHRKNVDNKKEMTDIVYYTQL